MTVFSKAREIRARLGEIEALLDKIATDYSISREELIEIVNDILGEFTSAYHEPMWLRLAQRRGK